MKTINPVFDKTTVNDKPVLDRKDEIHNVLDNSKLACYQKCPRMYMFQYLFHIRKEGKNHNLIFGTAFHKAKDVLFQKGYSLSSIDLAYEAFLKEYRKSFTEFTDGDFRGKNPANVKKALTLYIDQNKRDTFTVLFTEAAFQLAFGDRVLYGNMDSIVRDELRGVYSLETKTAGSRWSYLEDNFQMSSQGLLYEYFLHQYYKEKVYGVIFDVTIFKKTPENLRIVTEHKPETYQSFLMEMDKTISELDNDFQRLKMSTKDLKSLNCFYRNRQNCVQYNRICPYFEICDSHENPLKLERIPAGFKVEKWDPRDTGHKVILKEK